MLWCIALPLIKWIQLWHKHFPELIINITNSSYTWLLGNIAKTCGFLVIEIRGCLNHKQFSLHFPRENQQNHHTQKVLSLRDANLHHHNILILMFRFLQNTKLVAKFIIWAKGI